LVNFKDPTKFVRDDIEILSGEHSLDLLRISGKRFDPFRVARAVRDHDLLYVWFASWHSFFPVLVAQWLHKPVVLATGGYDSANLKDINYGHQRGGPRKLISRMILGRASALVVASEFARREIQGLNATRAGAVHVIYHGFKAPDHEPDPGRPRDPIALTVGTVTRTNLQRKGIEPFVRSACLVPEVTCYVVGRHSDQSFQALQAIASENVKLTGFLPRSELESLMRRAGTYVQPSRHEAFGMSVAEAMLAGCIPVISRNGALPEVVGETGVYLASLDPETIAHGIREAMAKPGEQSLKARSRVLELFSWDRRRRAILGLVSKVLAES
jgi:glycosyltransferase involved in cell wall biosynthesis